MKHTSFIFALLCAVAFATAATAVDSKPKVGEDTPMEADHFGPIRFGMTVEEASAAADMPLQENEDEKRPSDDCYYVYGYDDVIPNIMFMVESGKITNAYIYSPLVHTPQGLGAGSDLSDIKKAFPGKWTARKNIYSENGKDEDIIVKANSKSGYVFFMKGRKVEYYNAGNYDSIQSVEGCL